MENFQDRGVWIRIRIVLRGWIRIRLVLRGWIRIWIRIRSISDRIRNPAQLYAKYGIGSCLWTRQGGDIS